MYCCFCNYPNLASPIPLLPLFRCPLHLPYIIQEEQTLIGWDYNTLSTYVMWIHRCYTLICILYVGIIHSCMYVCIMLNTHVHTYIRASEDLHKTIHPSFEWVHIWMDWYVSQHLLYTAEKIPIHSDTYMKRGQTLSSVPLVRYVFHCREKR